MESSRNSTTMMGRKESTLPTPAQMPSTTSEWTTGLVPKAVSRRRDARRDPGHELLHEALQPRAHHAEVSQKTRPMMSTKAGMAVWRPVSTRSMRALRACSRLS